MLSLLVNPSQNENATVPSSEIENEGEHECDTNENVTSVIKKVFIIKWIKHKIIYTIFFFP